VFVSHTRRIEYEYRFAEYEYEYDHALDEWSAVDWAIVTSME
jgi:hypothetical protein